MNTEWTGKGCGCCVPGPSVKPLINAPTAFSWRALSWQPMDLTGFPSAGKKMPGWAGPESGGGVNPAGSGSLVLCPRAHCEGQSCFISLRFSEAKCQVLPLGHNPQQLQAREEWLGKAQQERAWACCSTARAQVGKKASGTWPGSAMEWPAGPGQ